MIEFIQNYWQYIATGILLVLEITLFLVKKRSKVVDNSLITHLCIWIDEAEKRFKVGSEKKAFVMEEAKKYLGVDFVASDISKMIEYILTIPQKKEKN